MSLSFVELKNTAFIVRTNFSDNCVAKLCSESNNRICVALRSLLRVPTEAALLPPGGWSRTRSCRSVRSGSGRQCGMRWRSLYATCSTRRRRRRGGSCSISSSARCRWASAPTNIPKWLPECLPTIGSCRRYSWTIQRTARTLWGLPRMSVCALSPEAQCGLSLTSGKCLWADSAGYHLPETVLRKVSYLSCLFCVGHLYINGIYIYIYNYIT